MALSIGILLAAAVGAFATVVGMDRERSFYSTVTIVVGSYYVLFAAIGGASSHTLVIEIAAGGVFMAAAVLGFRRSSWILVAALAGHGIFDLFHGEVIAKPGVPAWWPAFCAAYDVTAAAYLAWRLCATRSQWRVSSPSGISTGSASACQ